MRADADAALWDVAPPARPSRVAGVTMAGFRDRGRSPDGVRLIPHPAVTLVLSFGAGSIAVDDAVGQRQQGSLVAGLWLGKIRVRRAENFECVQVRLSPVVARAILGASLVELDGAAIPLGDVWGREAARITEQLHDLSSWEDRFAVTDALLGRRLAAGTPVDPEVAGAWQRIVASHGLIRIDPLATELGWSRKRLWSRFTAQIGLTPKRAAKIRNSGLLVANATGHLAFVNSACAQTAETNYLISGRLPAPDQCRA